MKVLTLILAVSASVAFAGGNKWTPLFNGKDLDGWIIKVNKSPVGENPWNMFRVEDGLLSASYADFDKKFEEEFGHIFTANAYTNYRFRCEYRFTGKQAEGGPKWAYANSGIMLHCPHPDTMDLNQSFPVSLEFQFLGDTRTTGSICTPGTVVDVDGETITKHVIPSPEKSLPLGEWVTAEAVVNDGKIQHWINGKLVMEYSTPKLDDGTPLTHGHIALQAESHPVQFRKIKIQILD
jgi:hypothetical protein